MDIPINAEVQCADGACGRSTNVVLDLETDEATDLLVGEKHIPRAERRVAIDQVVEANPHLIQLRRSRQQLARCKGIHDAFVQCDPKPHLTLLTLFLRASGRSAFHKRNALRQLAGHQISCRSMPCLQRSVRGISRWRLGWVILPVEETE